MPTVSLLQNATYQSERASVTVEVTPFEINLDETELARGPSEALAASIARGIKAIQASVAPATKKFRDAAERALSRGRRWAVERYPTGRPDSSDRLFNDSGQLGSQLGVAPDGDGFAITAAARGSALGDTASSMPARLEELVPALKDPFGDAGVRAAIDATAKVLFP